MYIVRSFSPLLVRIYKTTMPQSLDRLFLSDHNIQCQWMLKACQLRVYLRNGGSRQAIKCAISIPYNLQNLLAADELYESL